MNKYFQIASTAQFCYQQQVPINGLPRGHLTYCRYHSFWSGLKGMIVGHEKPRVVMSEKVMGLLAALERLDDDVDQDAIDLIQNYMKDKTEKNGYHSFRNYLLICLVCSQWLCVEQKATLKAAVVALQKLTVNKENWLNYFFPAKPFFGGELLFHGTNVNHNTIFVQGLRAPKSSCDLRRYAKYHNFSYGVSTTREIGVACMFAGLATQESCYKNRYVYVINYRGKTPGFDIHRGRVNLLGEENGDEFDRCEVNFPCNIKTRDIMGAYDLETRKWIENTTHYAPSNNRLLSPRSKIDANSFFDFSDVVGDREIHMDQQKIPLLPETIPVPITFDDFTMPV